jgi:hypothetical protein
VKQMSEEPPLGYIPQRADLYDTLICIGTAVCSFGGLFYLADRYNLIAPILAQIFDF